jgi:hypothetical protein
MGRGVYAQHRRDQVPDEDALHEAAEKVAT